MALQPTSPRLQRTDCQRILGIDYTHLKALCRIDGLKDNNSSQSTEEAHQDFMNSYQKIFLYPKKVLPGIPLKADSKTTHAAEKLKANESQASLDITRNKSLGRQTQETLINHMIKALKKFPIERSHVEHHAIHKMLKVFPCLTRQLPKQELQKISTIAIIETWERGQIIFGHNGFYLILKGSVRPYTQGTVETGDPNGPLLGVGCCFGSFEPPEATDAGVIIQCTLTQEPCEILKISNSGYAKLKKEIVAQNYALKESLIHSCHFYLQWPKLSINRLANLVQMRSFPANHILAKEGKVCPFVAYIRDGECNIMQDISTVMRSLQEKKGSRLKFVMVGRLGPMESFGEVSILLDQPSPCTIVTATEVYVGLIQPDALKGVDSVTSSLMLQTAQPTYGKLDQEEINKEYMRQEKQKQWDYLKKKVLSDALFYNGILQGSGKWTMNRGGRRPADTNDSTL